MKPKAGIRVPGHLSQTHAFGSIKNDPKKPKNALLLGSHGHQRGLTKEFQEFA